MGFHSLPAQVWADSFAHLLSIREVTQHSQCMTCVRHRRIIAKLSNDQLAREAQMQEYAVHLKRQYLDRVEYWKHRAQSRMRQVAPDSLLHISLIVDSMDHAKFRLPRSRVFLSKEFGGFLRPCLDQTAVIIHGYAVLVYLSGPHLPKDSSFMCDILMNCLDFLSSELSIDLRHVRLWLQSDNTCRETKNNCLTRAAAMLVAGRHLHSVRFNQLRSGHSHEDIDQMFSNMTTLLEAHPELHTTTQFSNLLRSWFEDTRIRPYEPVRKVIEVSAVRNWTLDL